MNNDSGGEGSSDKFDRGFAVGTRVVGEKAMQKILDDNTNYSPDFARILIEYVYGEFFSRPGLDLKMREVATVAALTALGTAQPQLKVHINGALNVGVTKEEVVEVIMHVAALAGIPAAMNGLTVAREVFADRK